MLHFLRNSVKSLPAKILIGLLVASFAVWGIGDIFSFRLDSRVAQVGDTEIPAADLANALTREQSRISRQAGQFISYDAMRAAGIDRNILGGLIRDAAFSEELTGLGISAPDEAVADAVRSNAAFQNSAGQFSAQTYSLLLAQQGFSPAQYEAFTRTSLTERLLTETAEAAILPPPGAGARLAAYQGETRSVSILTLNLDMAPDPGTPDEGALREFYDANPAMFTEPERRWGEYLHVDAEKLSAELVPDEATLRAAFDANIDAYTVAERRVIDQVTIPDLATAEAAMGRLVGGAATFDSLGAEFGLAADDLSLGQVTREDLPEEAADLVFGESEPGIVGPVSLPSGYAVYRIREITPGGTATFEDMRDTIANKLSAEELLVRAPEIANQIEELRAEGLQMSEISGRIEDTSAVAYGTFDGLARDATLAEGTAAMNVVASPAFISEVFTALDAEERDLLETPASGYVLVMVERIEPSALRPLDEVRERATAAWQNAERLTALEAQGAELADRLGEGVSIWDIGEALNQIAFPLQPFTRVAPPPALPAALVDPVFRGDIGTGVTAPNTEGTQVVVAQISSITTLTPEEMAARSVEMDQVLQASLTQDMAEYFSRAVVARHNAQIEPGVIDDVFRSLGGTGMAGSGQVHSDGDIH